LVETLSKLDLIGVGTAVCLGIGNFSDSVQARFQFALLRGLAEKLGVAFDRVTIFDPQLTQSEVEFAQSLGFTDASRSAADNLEGRYKAADKRTLVFMPHCPKQLTNNLLYANWNPQCLKNLVIICNSFERLSVSQPERILREQGATLILKARPFCTEVPLENSFRLSDVFNDLSVHAFEFPASATQQQTGFWSDVEAPSYSKEDLEFVRKQDESPSSHSNPPRSQT